VLAVVVPERHQLLLARAPHPEGTRGDPALAEQLRYVAGLCAVFQPALDLQAHEELRGETLTGLVDDHHVPGFRVLATAREARRDDERQSRPMPGCAKFTQI